MSQERHLQVLSVLFCFLYTMLFYIKTSTKCINVNEVHSYILHIIEISPTLHSIHTYKESEEGESQSDPTAFAPL